MKNLYKQFLIIFVFLISSFGLKAQISGPTSICQNSSANFTCSTAATYNWSVSPSGSETISNASIQNPDISFSAAGNYTITVNTTSPVNTFTLGVFVNPLPTVSIGSNSPICENGTLNLVASGGISYSWSGPNGFTSNIQNPSIASATFFMAANYTVTVADANGCMNANVTSVVINSLPSVMVNNNSPVCEGGIINLTALTGGGGTSYSWAGPNGFSSNLQNPSITNAALSNSGNYTVSVTVMGCVGSDFTSVNVQPSSDLSGTALSNSTPITAGQVILLTPIIGTTYYDTIATTNLNASGQYSFTSAPAGDYIIKCIPDSTTYPTLIETYYGDVAAWYLADTIHHDCSANSVANINVIEPLLLTGPGTISGTIIEGFGFGSRLINSNNEVQVPGGPLKLIDVNLVSLTSNTVVAQATSDFNGYYEFSNVAIGNYTLQVDILGLPMDSSYFIIIDPLLFSANVNQTASSAFTNLDFVADNTAIYIANSIGIKQNSTNENLISVYPNPAKNVINIKFQSGDKINGQIEIIDNVGKTVASQNLNSELTQVNIENLYSGIYFIKVKSEKGINTFRFIKQ